MLKIYNEGSELHFDYEVSCPTHCSDSEADILDPLWVEKDLYRIAIFSGSKVVFFANLHRNEFELTRKNISQHYDEITLTITNAKLPKHYEPATYKP